METWHRFLLGLFVSLLLVLLLLAPGWARKP